MSYVFLHHGGHGVARSFICPPDGKFILRETLRYSVVSFIYDAKIIPRQSAMSVFVRYCPYLSVIVRKCPFFGENHCQFFGGVVENSYL